MKKKILIAGISVLLAVVIFSTGIVVGVSESKNKVFGTIVEMIDKVSVDATIESSSYSFSSSMTMEASWKRLFRFDRENFYAADPATAKFALMMCLDAQDNCRLNVAGASNTDDRNNSAFPASIGFEETKTFFVGGDASQNVNDTTTMVVSYVKYNGGCDNNFFVNVSFCGTNGAEEWASNFDVGSENNEVYLGDVTDWEVKQNHKGFDVAATRSLKVLMEYLSTVKGMDNAVVNFLFNGYSRGAAIANIVATRYESAFRSAFPHSLSSYECYTFATPATTTSADASKANYIYNFVNRDDLVTCVPTEAMGFVRYGKDLEFSLLDEGNGELKAQYADIAKTAYKASGVAKLVAGMNAICSSRDDYYTTDATDASITITSSFATEKEANKYRNEKNLMFSALCPENATMFYRISEVTPVQGDKYEVKLTVAPAFIGKLLPSAMGASTGTSVDVMSFGLLLIPLSRYQSMIGGVLGVSTSTITNMHLPISYLVYVNSLDAE